MILAIDTSTRVASLALYSGDGVQAEYTWLAGREQTSRLAPAVDMLLRGVGVRMDQLRGVAVARGPGSFNGLRVALSFAKGLALALDLPIFGVPTLDAVAQAHAPVGVPLWALVDAGRRRVGAAHYQPGAGAWQRTTPYHNTTLPELCERVRETTLFAGEISSAEGEELRSRLGPLAVVASPAANLRRAGFVGELAWARLLADQPDELVGLEPIYLHHQVQG